MPASSKIVAAPDLEPWAAAFEEAWQRRPEPPLADFLPGPGHPDYAGVVCELACIDLELRWSRGRLKRLDEYLAEHPDVFADPGRLTQLAFEEYRQRLQAGEAVEPAYYARRYGLDVADWPAPPGALDATPYPTIRLRVPPIDVDPPTRPEPVAPVAADGLPRVGQQFLGFTLVDVLGRGSFGKVFLAKQLELADRLVALKISSDIQGEPQKLARLQHGNIVPVYSAHRVGAVQAVCMPYFGRTTLAQVIEALGRTPGAFPASGRALLSTLFERRASTLPDEKSPAVPDSCLADGVTAAATPILDLLARLSHVEAALWIAARLADGLAHAHERGILHRDLKPANVLISDEGQPMLLDFNLALDTTERGAERLRIGGTLPYMAPELLDACLGGPRRVDERGDLYALGVLLFETLTGRLPFEDPPGRAEQVLLPMLAARRKGAPSARAFNPNVPRAADAIVRKLLDPDPARRYRSAAQVREDLERQLAQLPLKHAPDRWPPERLRKWRRRHPRLATATLVGLAATLLLVLPATAIAVREHRAAEQRRWDREAEAESRRRAEAEAAAQRLQAEIGEARRAADELGAEARSVQVLLATRGGDRALLDECLARGRAVLARYGLGDDPQWAGRPLFARLPADRQEPLRAALGEMLLAMTRAELLRAGDRDEGARAALRWNLLAEDCLSPERRPRLLARQRDDLRTLLPGEAVPTVEVGQGAESDPYHDGADAAMKGRYREALARLRPFTDAHPQHFPAWFVRGVCHDQLGQLPDAAACFSVCVALEPEMPWGWFNRGVVRLRQPDFAGAEADFTSALRLRSDWTPARLNRAIARKGKRDFAGAVADLDQILAKPGAPARAWFLRAEARALAGDKEGANRDRAAGMGVTPADELSWSTRGYARMNREPVEALADFQRALEINPRSRDALLNKSIVLSETLGRPREAVAVLDTLLEYYPDHHIARAGRGVVLARLGECARARQDAVECLRQERTPFVLFQMAGLYAQLSRHEKEPDAKQESLRLLGQALRTGFTDLKLLASDPDLAPIRDDPEYRRLADAAARLAPVPVTSSVRPARAHVPTVISSATEKRP
jgi:serine/threonine protein kinase/Flp pilus assembly protein TadD